MKNIISLFRSTFICLLIFATFSVSAQTGKLLSQKSFKADKKIIAELNNTNPGANYTDTFALAEMSRIKYKSDGYSIDAYLIRPTKEGKYPCLVYNRDGWENTGALTDIFVAENLHKIARWGYVVVASQYRGTAGSDGDDEFGGEDVNDVVNLIELLGKIPEADTTRIGMYGRNRGGMMTFLALSQTKRIDAAIVSSPISNIFVYIAENVEMYDVLERLIPDYPANRVKPLKKRSLVFWGHKPCKKTPILILQGSCDKYIHPIQSMNCFEELFKELHPARLVILEGADNELLPLRNEADEMIKSWLNKYVRNEEDFPEIIDLTR
ncbi:MAG: prolyl oligopeptidase family serine peptidase [Bacteroidota bacterium]|nr:prolyl oligopeptidase family serine peptidase [Bacteroidota bacterium]